MKRGLRYSGLSLMVLAALLLQPLVPLLALSLNSSWSIFPALISTAHAEESGENTIFLPLVTVPPGPPAFEIISPADGSSVSRGIYVAIQPTDPASISSVAFSAGGIMLTPDSANPYRAYFDATSTPASDVEISVTATAPSGETTKSITVSVIPSPPSSATVNTDGGVLASEIGSIITVPPDAVPNGTSISVTERSQEEVTANNGIDWEGLGVIFLGAQEITSEADFERPLNVLSAGFGERVQPGQAVVNYRIMPDANGDGADEIVVINTASVTPNGDVISDPVPQTQVGTAQTVAHSRVNLARNPQGGLDAPIGSFITIESMGFNVASATGNIAHYTSAVDGSEVEIQAFVQPALDDSGEQTIFVPVPYLPIGAASFTLRNESTESSVGPFNVNIQATPSPSRPAIDVINEMFTVAHEGVDRLATLAAEEGFTLAVTTADAHNHITSMQLYHQELAKNPTPSNQEALDGYAAMIENQNVVTLLSSEGRQFNNSLLDTKAALKDIATGLSLVAGGLLAIATAPATVPAGIFMAAIVLTGIAAGVFIGSGISDLLPPSAGSGGMTGMGSASPPGGPTGGNVIYVGGRAQGDAERILIKIFSGGSSIPFTGMTDAGGYFFIPLIPEGEPFTAVAFDTATGETRTIEGVGPALDDSLYLLFNFLVDDGSGATEIEIGDLVMGEITNNGQLDLYSFEASAGQDVYFDLQEYVGVSGLDWRVLNPLGETVFSTCFGCTGDPGLYDLPLGGTYTMWIGEADSTVTGTYQLQLWNVPAADEFNISIGDVITDGIPGPGAGHIETPGVRDIYTFNATPGQTVYLDLQGYSGVSGINWRLLDAEDTILFSTCFGCGEPGVQHLTLGGSYRLIVGHDTDDSIGTYQFQLWNVPDPDEFAIAIGDTISDGIPGPGAGNIETPGVRDIYTFSATAAQDVNFELVSYSGPGGVNWILLDPKGAQVFSSCFGCGDPGTHTLSLAGTYTMIIGDDIDDNTGTYVITLTDVSLFSPH